MKRAVVMSRDYQAETHKQSSHRPIREGKTIDPLLLRQTVHHVQERDEARRLHRSPADLAGDIESRCGRGLAHGVVAEDPLVQSELRRLGFSERERHPGHCGDSVNVRWGRTARGMSGAPNARGRADTKLG